MQTRFALLTILGILFTASAITTSVITSSVIAAENCGAGRNASADCGHRCPVCPQCSRQVCTSFVEPIKEKHHCFNVERNEICVPAITLPHWTDILPFFKCQDSCCNTGGDHENNCAVKECRPAPRCGYVKVVNVLKKHEYECDACGYKWKIEAPSCDSGACRSSEAAGR